MTSPQRPLDWVSYTQGQQVRCPNQECKAPLGIVGMGFRIDVRKNPWGRRAAPTAGVAYSAHCRACGINVEYVQRTASDAA